MVGTYCSEAVDSSNWKSVEWSLQVLASQPGGAGTLVTLYLQTSAAVEGPWADLIPGGENAGDGAFATGAVADPGPLTRARLDVKAGEKTVVEVRLVGRPE